jgi:hypothetical protein
MGKFSIAHNELPVPQLADSIVSPVYMVLQLQYTQPLLAGSGTEYTHAGPFNTQFRVFQASIRSGHFGHRLAVATFELNVGNSRDVEDTYWDLYWAMHLPHQRRTRNSYLRWALRLTAAGKFSDLDEWQTREAYFQGQGGGRGLAAEPVRPRDPVARLCGLT